MDAFSLQISQMSVAAPIVKASAAQAKESIAVAVSLP
jgi:hypothetical protein